MKKFTLKISSMYGKEVFEVFKEFGKFAVIGDAAANRRTSPQYRHNKQQSTNKTRDVKMFKYVYADVS